MRSWIPLVDSVLPYLALLACTAALIFYRLNRKFPKERVKGRWEFLDANLVELLLAAMFLSVAAPGWIGLAQLFGGP